VLNCTAITQLRRSWQVVGPPLAVRSGAQFEAFPVERAKRVEMSRIEGQVTLDDIGCRTEICGAHHHELVCRRGEFTEHGEFSRYSDPGADQVIQLGQDVR
jgi:hypothetical protein